MNPESIDATDRMIINGLQGGFEIVERPYKEAGARLGLEEEDLIARLATLVSSRALSRFGPMYNAERLGGAVSLCAVAVPQERFDSVAEQINSHREVAHNYARDHALNMWFVLACETPDEIAATLTRIETETGLKVHDFPKEREFFIGLRVET